jgi:hypothetical protein
MVLLMGSSPGRTADCTGGTAAAVALVLGSREGASAAAATAGGVVRTLRVASMTSPEALSTDVRVGRTSAEERPEGGAWAWAWAWAWPAAGCWPASRSATAEAWEGRAARAPGAGEPARWLAASDLEPGASPASWESPAPTRPAAAAAAVEELAATAARLSTAEPSLSTAAVRLAPEVRFAAAAVRLPAAAPRSAPCTADVRLLAADRAVPARLFAASMAASVRLLISWVPLGAASAAACRATAALAALKAACSTRDDAAARVLLEVALLCAGPAGPGAAPRDCAAGVLGWRRSSTACSAPGA